MATAEAIARPPDRHPRRKHFTSFVKRLANLKGSSDSGLSGVTKSKKNTLKNNPYPLSGNVDAHRPTSIEPSLNGHLSFATQQSVKSMDDQSLIQSKGSILTSQEEQNYPTSKRSAAPTVSTNPETTHSDTAQSKAGTVTTAAGALSSHGIGGEGSTFSSPAPSIRSMNTTLTTIQPGSGGVPNSVVPGPTYSTTSPPLPFQNGQQQQQQQSAVQFTHQFPPSNTSPPSAIPSHMAPHGHPPTYTTATANNLLTDNASILTLASSSKRRRRNSLDTNASVRALAPSSIFGGSRESLPLSVLSGPVPDRDSASAAGGLAAVYNRPSIGGLPAAERASVYSSQGVAPNNRETLSERNSYYANPKARDGGDGGSVRSGNMSHHGRNDSFAGSVAGLSGGGGTGGPSSPLASPREGILPGSAAGRGSRRSSGWDGEPVLTREEDESVDGDPGEGEGDVGRVDALGTVSVAEEK